MRPGHFRTSLRNQGRYGDLRIDRNFMQLWRDIRKSVVGQPRFRPESIPAPDTGARTAAGILDHIMNHLAKAQGKEVWCEKSPMHVHHLQLLAEAFPQARFIHVIRDGRDCAASFHRRWRYNPVRTVFRWKQAVSSGMQQGRALGSPIPRNTLRGDHGIARSSISRYFRVSRPSLRGGGPGRRKIQDRRGGIEGIEGYAQFAQGQ